MRCRIILLKKTKCDKLVTKVNAIDTGGFVLKTQYNTDKLSLGKKKPDTSDFVKDTNYNAKITEIEGKIPRITGLATTTALNVVGEKILLILIIISNSHHIST